jgi:hypothetical protein
MRTRNPLMMLAATVCAVALVGCGSGSSSSSSSSGAGASTSTNSPATASSTATTTSAATTLGGPAVGFEGIPLEKGPLLASPGTTTPTAADGVQCKPGEQLAYHIHAHLAVFDNGTLYAVPPGIGIPGAQVEQSRYGPVAVGGQCYFWLHTHTSDGIIHIESPERRIFTLGDFFGVWRQPLSAERVGDLHGRITAFVNGKTWHKSPTAIPLLSHEDIQLEIGQPAPPLIATNWKRTQL